MPIEYFRCNSFVGEIDFITVIKKKKSIPKIIRGRRVKLNKIIKQIILDCKAFVFK